MGYPFPPLTTPDGALLPLPYRWLLGHGLTSLTPWHFIDNQDSALKLRNEFLCEVASPNKAPIADWMPIARHQAQDDVAGFVLEGSAASPRVAVVHLTWRGSAELPGFPSIQVYDDLWAWMRSDVLTETAEWAMENELEDLLSE